MPDQADPSRPRRDDHEQQRHRTVRVSGPARHHPERFTGLRLRRASQSAYAPEQICGSGFGRVADGTLPVTDVNDIVRGHVHLLYSARTGENCVVTIKSSFVGQPTMTRAVLFRKGIALGAEDRELSRYYAGPVIEQARDRCVLYQGVITNLRSARDLRAPAFRLSADRRIRQLRGRGEASKAWLLIAVQSRAAKASVVNSDPPCRDGWTPTASRRTAPHLAVASRVSAWCTRLRGVRRTFLSGPPPSGTPSLEEQIVPIGVNSTPSPPVIIGARNADQNEGICALYGSSGS